MLPQRLQQLPGFDNETFIRAMGVSSATYPPPPPQPPPYGAPQGGYPAQQRPDSNLVWGILCAVLCCLPLGIVSIVYASKVSGLWAQGRYAEAQEASANAKKWAIWGAVAGVIVGIIYAIIAVAGGMSNNT